MSDRPPSYPAVCRRCIVPYINAVFEEGEKRVNNHIVLIVEANNEGQCFAIESEVPLEYLMNLFLTIKRYDEDTVVFRYNGNKIKDSDTTSSLNMNEGDNTIEVYRRNI